MFLLFLIADRKIQGDVINAINPESRREEEEEKSKFQERKSGVIVKERMI